MSKIIARYLNTTDVALMGTCGDTVWRRELIKLLDSSINLYNPVVEHWTEDCKVEEIKQREQAIIVLYVLSPLMRGIFSIAELVESSVKRPISTIFMFMDTDIGINGKEIAFDGKCLSSIRSIADMAIANGATELNSLQEIADYINTRLAR